ncbi:MAG: 4Fe-4S binding protein [Deltaproteobacteria bacterium]|jgi:pyruvate ferredoxin oxidoreductase delta subunit|nr:4Fe-4S binding protein [Deltaproteobacteria bacterium]MBT4265599.1 4Fe-4S binding protein [Deltaproteobacteria bacterium]MBT4640733.1 4Fe-4S binding protein [Deltaproteobacteria bacterium]MBT6504460.1 4Fe-4S binding protein [Deltaproteobacteria bacterium]MBT7888526.1 4Fe-4S binding protein [Deltaproteobacteria bacterium]
MSEKKPKSLPAFDYKICMACKDCIAVCPLSCLVADKTGLDKYKKAYPQLGDHNPCNGCKICAKDCPVDAITMVSTEQAA